MVAANLKLLQRCWRLEVYKTPKSSNRSSLKCANILNAHGKLNLLAKNHPKIQYNHSKMCNDFSLSYENQS